MKRNTKILCVVLATVCLFCIWFSACGAEPTNNSATGVDWIREESHFVDYSIDGDVIKFRYLFTFENTYHRDMIISYPQVEFSRKELKGWLEYKDSYVGVSEDGTTDTYIPAGEKVGVVLTFEGKYLGGEVNTELSIPDSIVLGQKFAPQAIEEQNS